MKILDDNGNEIVDYVRFKQDDGSEWLLLPNLELRLLKARKGSVRRK